jgi:hypothetical protein
MRIPLVTFYTHGVVVVLCFPSIFLATYDAIVVPQMYYCWPPTLPSVGLGASSYTKLWFGMMEGRVGNTVSEPIVQELLFYGSVPNDGQY